MQKSLLKRLSTGAFAPFFVITGAVFALCLFLAPAASAQGIVSSTMTGTVVDPAGKPIVGATVTAVHTPTNTTYTDVTGSTGRFSFTGMRVGGPYTVSATIGGYRIESLNNVQTSLGQNTDVRLEAAEEVVAMEKFVAAASRVGLDAAASGAASVVDNQRLEAQPTTSRAFADLAKTNPFVSIRAGQQIEALGINSRFNTITLDGAKINDSFGLNSTGLFSLGNPFSLDAVEQFSISLTPYDVRQSGFAGADINVVSKSGTNEFHGSIYDIFTDQNWQGKDVSGSTLGTRPALKERTYGFTFGGPIIKDRLFFFTNFEKFIQDRSPVTPNLTPDPAFLSAVQTKIGQLPSGPDMGAFGGLPTNRLGSTTRLAKIDWNISQDHRLMVRYSDTIGVQPNTGSLNANSFSQPLSLTNQPSSFPNTITGLSSNFYFLDVKEHVWAAQLFDNWSEDFKTQFSYSNTKQDSVRDTPVKFPEVRIFNVPGTASNGTAVTNGDALRFGTEISSMGNELHIKTQTFAGSGDYTWQTFTFTAGGDREQTSYLNLFRQGSYGVFDYWNLADFQADKPFGFERSVVQTGFPTADISKFAQTGVFIQAKWEPIARFNATLGLRVDYIGSPIAPPENTAFKNAFGITNAGTIDGTTSPAPRFSFNYALDQQRRTQIRGGLGVFLGRNPWVWISNSFGNTGVGRFNISNTVPSATPPNTTVYTGPTLGQYLNGTYSNTDPAYKFDPANPIGTTNVAGTASSINLIKPSMKLPTIERGNLAIDHQLPFLDATLSAEYVQTNQLDALFVDNMNLKPTTVGADGRQRFAGASAGANALVPAFGNVIRTRDVHAGVSKYESITLDRPMHKGWAYTVAYTHGHASEAQTLNSSTANSQWQFNSVFNQNQVELARSDYEIRDRVQVSVSKEFKFWRKYVTTASLYYEGRTGQPYSWVYTNDLNGDGFGNNDLIAVPSGLSDPRFDFSGMTTAQQNTYFAFISQDKDLVRFAGSYAPRNVDTTSWQNRLDLSFVQEIPAYKKVKLELRLDFLNFGYWLKKSLFNSYIEEINTSTTNGGQTRALGSATYTSTGQIKPTITTDPITGNIIFGSTSTIVANNGDSRWKIQGSIALKF
jgi:hypothetical protein